MTSGNRRTKNARSEPVAVFLALALVVPFVTAGIVVWQIGSTPPLRAATAAEPVIMAVESATRSGAVDVTVTFHSGTPFELRLPTSGMITRVDIEPGQLVKPGDVVVSLNSSQIVAYNTPEPLWEDVSSGADRRTIQRGQEVLQELGYYEGAPDGLWGPKTRAGIIEFNAHNGYGADNPVLSIGALVWLGSDSRRVGSVSATVGAVMQEGDVMFSSAGSPWLEVVEPPSLPDRDYVIRRMEWEYPYEVGSGRVEGAWDDGRLFELQPGESGLASLRYAEAVEIGIVPSVALVTDARGTSCLLMGESAEPLVVEPLGGTVGSVDVDAALIGEQIVVNPRVISENATCG